VALVLLIGMLAACEAAPAAKATPSTSAPPTTASPSPTTTLDEEIGAVMMVGFRGPLTASVLADWTQHQYGGLLIVNLNHNAQSAADASTLITQLRAVTRHRLIAATDQEGGGVCIAVASVPCKPMPVGQTDTTLMATALRSLGFDLDLGPVSDVCSGPGSIMWGRCYGTSPGPVANDVGAAVDGIHAAGMLSAAKHFPGHGDTTVSSETSLPRIDESIPTLLARDFPPFEAAIAHRTDFVLVGHLWYPAIDPHRSADLSPATYNFLRADLEFRGAILSDDMEMGAITNSTPAPEAAVQFLIAGGDMVMIAHDLSIADATFAAIKHAVESGRLPRQRLDDAVAALVAVGAG
jgi:beta-N-acetylhexosaminidase